MPLLIGLLFFVAVFLVAYELLRPKRNLVARRALGAADSEVHAADRTRGSFARRVLSPLALTWGRRIARLLPQNFVRSIDHMLVMANEPWSLSGFLFVWALVIGMALALYYYIISVSPDITAMQMLFYGFLLVPTVGMLPYMLLRHKVKKRQKSILRALPDAMDLLVTSIEAGLGVDSAFALVAEKTSGPMSETVGTYLRAVGFGQSRRDALEMAANRTGVPEFIAIAHAVNQAEQLGTTLGDVLRVQADDLRVARRQRAESAAQRAPVLMTIPLVTCFLPAIGAVVLVPSVLNLIRFAGGMGGQ